MMIEADTNTVSADEATEFDRIASERYNLKLDDPPEVTEEKPLEPSPKAGASDLEGEQKPNDTSSQANGFDFDSLSPEAKSFIEKLQVERDAAIGRVAPTQRQVADLQRQLQSLKQQPAKPAPPASPPESQSSASSYDLGADSEAWEELKRDYPGATQAQLKAIQAALERAEHAEKAVLELKQQANERFERYDSVFRQNEKTEELNSLSKVHPDWQDIVYPKTQDDAIYLGRDDQGNDQYMTKAFYGWISHQHPDIQKWYSSEKAEDNIALLDLFKRDQQRSNAPSKPETENPEAAQAAAAHAKRQQRRESNVQPEIRGGSPSAVRLDESQMSDAELWDQLAKQRAQQRR